MRDELAVETIEKSFQIGRNHPLIQQHRILRFIIVRCRSARLTPTRAANDLS